MAESVSQFLVRISTFFWSTMLCFLHLCGLRVTLSFARLLMGWTNRRHWACLGGCAIPTLGRAIDLASLVDHVLVLMEMFQLCQTKWAKLAHGQKKRRLRDASQEIPYTGLPHRSCTKFFYSWDGCSVRMHGKAGSGQGSEEGKRYNLFINHHNHHHKQRSDTKKAFIVVVS